MTFLMDLGLIDRSNESIDCSVVGTVERSASSTCGVPMGIPSGIFGSKRNGSENAQAACATDFERAVIVEGAVDDRDAQPVSDPYGFQGL